MSQRNVQATLAFSLALILGLEPVATAQNQTPAPGSPQPPATQLPAPEEGPRLPPFYRHRMELPTRSLNFENTPRIRQLIRAGTLYLSLADAISLALENSLDVELQRYNIAAGNMDLLRTKGGGLPRGITYTVAEAPAGVGGPLTPLVTNAASSTSVTPGTSVASNALELGVLGSAQTSLSISNPLSNGTAIPNFDPSLTGLLNWTHLTTPQSNTVVTGTSASITNTFTGNANYIQNFSPGTQLSAGFNDLHQSLNSTRAGYNPFTSSSLGVTVTQPLFRGFGPSLNRRFIRIAANAQQITNQLFRQQLIATVYGVVRLYTDLVALYEDAKVKQDTLALVEKLQSDTKAQVEAGTLAPVELTRANAQVLSVRQQLINSNGLLEEEEAIFKAVLTRRGNEDPEIAAARIIPTDPLSIPEKDEVRPIQDLLGEAVSRRPDLNQAKLQIENTKIGLTGSRNALLPEIDLVGTAQNNGLAGALNPLNPTAQAPNIGGFGNALDQVFSRKYPTYGIGVQLTLPIHNRIAEADLARDELALKQTQIRYRQLQNQARLEVEDALIAMRRSRASYDAAVQARVLQEESLKAEQFKFEVGASTSFFVIQYENLLAQARSAEVAAKSAYVKGRAALQRAMGTILNENNVSIEAALKPQL